VMSLGVARSKSSADFSELLANPEETLEGTVTPAAQAQSEIIRKNIAAIAEMQRREDATLPAQDKIAGWITAFSGSMAFVYIHTFWFGLWILLNVGIIHIPHISQFDPYPFGLLTLVVSLEAIFLSTFVLIAQNRLARQSERRSELDLHINLLAEQKAAKVLEMLDQIIGQLDQANSKFTLKPDIEVAALQVSPQPDEVLEIIQEAVKEETDKALTQQREQMEKQ
jgi:uncharacterized membrane protein